MAQGYPTYLVMQAYWFCFNIYLSFMRMPVWVYEFMCTMCVQAQPRPEEGIGFPRTRITVGCEPSVV